MSRAREDSAANSAYQWDTQMSEPAWLERVPRYRDEFPDEPRGLPDVPLNADHRYCTPAPMDPHYKDEHVDPDDVLPPYNEADWAPLPDDEEELTSARQPLAPPGTAQNPLVIEDDGAGRYRKASALEPPPGIENSPAGRRTKRQKANNGQALSSTNKRSQPSANNGSSAAGLSSTPKKGRGARGRPPAAAKSPTGQAKSKKNASNKYTPKVSSPLKQVASKAATNAPDAPVTQGRWYIPPRKHSTGSVSVSSDSSGSSDSECDE
ncbi:hypothetical protein VTO73DRAFT_8565 [Trametes versicolor]